MKAIVAALVEWLIKRLFQYFSMSVSVLYYFSCRLENCMTVIRKSTHWWVHPHPISLCWRLHTHRSERWYCMNTHAGLSALCPFILFTQLVGSFHRPRISVGHFWNSLSCRKAMTPLQIPSQHTMTATQSVSWEGRRLCDPKIKLCWGSVCVCVCCGLVSDKSFEQGGVNIMGPLTLEFRVVWWNSACRSVGGLLIHIRSLWRQICVLMALTLNKRRQWIIDWQEKVCAFTICHCWSHENTTAIS